MRWLWCGGFVLSAVLGSVAYADTVYLKDGQAVWGTESYEEGGEIVLIRPSGPVRYPKAQVERLEQTKISLPRFYSVPTEAPPVPGGPGAAGVPGAPPAPGAGVPGAPGSPPPPSEGAAPGAPPAPTELPPAPPPPPPQ